MKIAISSEGDRMDSAVDPRFGRAAGFILYDTETGGFNHIDNGCNQNAMQGAGIQAAKKIVDSGATALITGHCGPKAFAALKSAGVKIYNGGAGTVSECIERFRAGVLGEYHSADVEGHWR